jgi:hypothetical protein
MLEEVASVIFWATLEEAGHSLTIVSGLIAGRSLYYCEKCAALVLIKDSGILLFHPALYSRPGCKSTIEKCSHADASPLEPLKVKLDAIEAADWERLKEI